MRRILVLCSVLVLAFAGQVHACKNLDLNVGILDTPEGHVFAQVIATFIHERTAVKTGIYFFKTNTELEAAIDAKKVQIIVEDVNDVLAMHGIEGHGGPVEDFEKVKTRYRTEKGLLWLESFDFTDVQGMRSPIIREKLLDKFPALPRVLAKLTRSISDAERELLLSAVNDDGVKPSNAAKNFLMAKRLI